MLKLINVCKSYKYGKEKVMVLDKINLDFKNRELVFILGNSGSGKSTLLNIIGGLLAVDEGSIMLDDRDITKFNNDMLCNYRNNMVGYVFQDYHLIEYMSVLDNVKLGMTIGSFNNIKIDDVLKKVGIYEKRRFKVNKLSGGEKQRVAIARAIINNPDIILCDEPTGALDSFNSIKIMEILKELSKDKLVIVVSHDSVLANKYGDRIINIVDGKIDYYPQIDDSKFNIIKKKKIKFIEILKLAIKNLSLKKGRTILTSLAVSIGFICMLLVLCLYKSFNDDINKLESNIVSIFPISVYNGDFEMMNNDLISSNNIIIRRDKNEYIHTNIIDNKYLDYVDNIDEIDYISYDYDISMPLISDRYKLLDNGYMKMMPSNNYDILYGRNINSINDIVLKVDSNNNVSSELLDVFNIDSDIEYSDIVGRKIKVILNDLYYLENGKYYYINNNNKNMYNDSDLELEIVGIVREKEMVDNNNYFYYNNELINYITTINGNSEIVLKQKISDYNVLGMNINKDKMLSYLGYNSLPIGIDIYVSNLDNKEIVIDKLNKYNDENNKLIYVDTMNDAINIFKNIINIITVILVIFSFISIIVSCLMVFILTNNRVMERVKEIGILRSLGARNKDISRMFNMENIIISVIASLIGIIVIMLIKEPVNYLMSLFMDSEGIFKIYSDLVIISVLFNIFIVVLSGYIPSKMAGKKNILDCIYNRI